MLEADKQKNYFLSAIFLCGLLTVIKLLSLYYFRINLWVDEAQYWLWSKDLASGYYSKPPLIAWIIHLTTHIFGDNEFGVRFASPVIHFLTAIFIFLLGKNLSDEKTGFFSALIYITLPAVTISSGFISTDAPLLLFWAAATYFLIRGVNNGTLMNWTGYAICLGLGCLSKYTFAVFIMMSLGYIFMNRKGKDLLKMDFWAASFFAFLIFLPNLIWNYNNHFVSFTHTEENVIIGGSGGGVKPLAMLGFIGSQFIVFGPAMLFWIIALIKDKQYRNIKDPLILFSIPLLAIGIIVSFFSGAQAHWAAPTYIGATIITAGFLIKNNNIKALKIILIINLFIFILCLNIRIPASLAGNKANPLNRVEMWYQPESQVRNLLKEYPDLLLVSDERKLIAPLTFALKDLDLTIYKWNPNGYVRDHFDMTRSFSDESERPVLFISRFDIIEGLSKIYFNAETIRQPDDRYDFYLYMLKGRRTIK